MICFTVTSTYEYETAEILQSEDVSLCPHFLIRLVFTLQTPPEPQTHLDSVPVLSIADRESSSPAEPDTESGLDSQRTFQRESSYCMKPFSLLEMFAGGRAR